MSSLNTIVVNPQKYFGSGNAITSRTVGTNVSTLVTPAANTNGVVIYHALAVTAGTGVASVGVDTSAPVAWGDAILLAVSVATYGSSPSQTPLFIPAGLGLYTVGTAASVYRYVIYEVL